MWETIEKTIMVDEKSQLYVGVVEQYRDKRLMGTSIKIRDEEFPANSWRKVRETIDLLLAKIVAEGGEEF